MFRCKCKNKFVQNLNSHHAERKECEKKNKCGILEDLKCLIKKYE